MPLKFIIKPQLYNIKIHKDLLRSSVIGNEVILKFSKTLILNLFYIIKQHTLFQQTQLLDIIVVDVLGHKVVIYLFFSCKFNNLMRCITNIKDFHTTLASCASLYKSASWSECEI